MNSYGPFIISSHLNTLASFPINNIPIPLVLGKNSLIEFINAGGYFLNISFQSQGNVIQEPYSKAIYKAVQDSQGTQVVTVTAIRPAQSQIPALSTPYVPPPRENSSVYFFINTYQEDEMEWYAPTSIVKIPGSIRESVQAPTVGGFNLLVPDTSVAFQDFSNPLVYIYGFDLSGTAAAALASGTMLIQPGGPQYSLTAPTDQGFLWSVRYNPPLLFMIAGGGGANVVVPALGTSAVALTVFSLFD